MSRISRGSGTSEDEVQQLLAEHKKFSKMIGKMGKMGKGLGARFTRDSVYILTCVDYSTMFSQLCCSPPRQTG